ncbi:MAG: hypothetical protein ACR2HJ_05505 [Fimbriimonadales bacterium]
MMPRRRFHQAVFAAAGVYNIGWGLYSAVDPQWFFRFVGMPPLNHAPIFACLGMVIALYGILYLEVARSPERGRLIAAVGLLGKTLGPAGMAYLVATGVWPARAAALCVTNDLIWWLPFGLYIYDSSRSA